MAVHYGFTQIPSISSCTDDMARRVWLLVEKQAAKEVFNVCGGLISPREIAAMAGCAVDRSGLDAGALPRVVNVSG